VYVIVILHTTYRVGGGGGAHGSAGGGVGGGDVAGGVVTIACEPNSSNCANCSGRPSAERRGLSRAARVGVELCRVTTLRAGIYSNVTVVTAP